MVGGFEATDGLAEDPPRSHRHRPERITDDRDLIQLLRPLGARRHLESHTDLITCSLCLRVLRGSEWVEAEDIIREIRSYELEAPPRLHSGVCEHCAEAILGRRAQVTEAAAA
jgi:hypothetical protein